MAIKTPMLGSARAQRSLSAIQLKFALMSAWEKAKEEKVYNYDLNCMYKLLPGDFNLSVQLNIERGQNRRKPMRFRAVREPFNNLRWNFTKLKPNEILLYLRCKDSQSQSGSDPLDRDVIAANAAPIERGHSLIIPDINRCIPQVLNDDIVRLATDVMLLIDDHTFHVLFNSLLGLASINHLHLHTLFWPYDSDLINRRCEHLYDNVYIIRRPMWFVHALVFQMKSADDYEKFIDSIVRCAEYLSSKEVAHNLFFSRAQPLRTSGDVRSEDVHGRLPQYVTAYLFPRNPVVGVKPIVNFCPAVLELSGCLVAHSWRFFESVTEEAVLRVVDENATLPDSRFNQIINEIVDMLTGKTISASDTSVDENSSLPSPELDEMRDSFQTFDMHSPRHFFTEERTRFTFNTEDETKRLSKKEQSPKSV